MGKKLIGLGFLLATSVFALGAAEPNSAFVNDKTIFFGRVQTDRVDMDLIEQFIFDSLADSATTQPTQITFKKDLQKQLGEVTRWLREFKEAGGHEIDAIAQSDTMNLHGPVTLVPLDSNANAQQIAALFYSGHKDGATAPKAGSQEQKNVEIVPGKAVIAGEPEVRNELKTLAAAPAPQLVAAISSTNDAPAMLIFAPDAKLRADLIKNLPATILMHPTGQIVNGLTWAEEYATMPPDISWHMIIQCKDANSATQTSALLTTALAMLMGDSNLGPIANRLALIRLLTPHVKADRVLIDMEKPQLAELARVLKPQYDRAMMRDLRIESMSHMRQIVMAAIMYKEEHKGQWPAKLDDVKAFLKGGGNIFVNPRDPKRQPAYVYLKPNVPIANPSQLMVLYEAHDKFGDGVNAGFADGHIEFINSSQRFKDLLLQSLQDNSPEQ
jgi:prepilin-type processing-associated H-X9-DG protein